MARYQLTQIAPLLPFPIYLWSSQTILLAIYCINPYALKPLPELSPRPNMPYLQTGPPSTHVCISWFTLLCSLSFTPPSTNPFRTLVLCIKLLLSCPTLCDPMDCSPQGSMGFSMQEYWSGLKNTGVG